MTQPIISTPEVEGRLVDHLATDGMVIRAMLVSTDPEVALGLASEPATPGRINYLMEKRHGSPFEHNQFQFYVKAPIFIFREFHRHRIGWSYNEQSGRYGELPPEFWVPDSNRKMVQEGKPGSYTFVKGSDEQWMRTIDRMEQVYTIAYRVYQEMRADGIANEVARAVLPVGLYSRMFATCNARSLMAFLSLRTLDEGTFPSTPMQEIHDVAKQLEAAFALHMPITHEAFCRNGRVAP